VFQGVAPWAQLLSVPPSTSRKRWPFPGFEIVYRTDTLRHSTGEPKRHRIFLLALLRAE
jgi:hypothetical protein